MIQANFPPGMVPFNHTGDAWPMPQHHQPAGMAMMVGVVPAVVPIAAQAVPAAARMAWYGLRAVGRVIGNALWPSPQPPDFRHFSTTRLPPACVLADPEFHMIAMERRPHGDLVMLQSEGTPSGQVEVRTLYQRTQYQTCSDVWVTSIPAGPGRTFAFGFSQPTALPVTSGAALFSVHMVQAPGGIWVVNHQGRVPDLTVTEEDPATGQSKVTVYGGSLRYKNVLSAGQLQLGKHSQTQLVPGAFSHWWLSDILTLQPSNAPDTWEVRKTFASTNYTWAWDAPRLLQLPSDTQFTSHVWERRGALKPMPSHHRASLLMAIHPHEGGHRIVAFGEDSGFATPRWSAEFNLPQPATDARFLVAQGGRRPPRLAAVVQALSADGFEHLLYLSKEQPRMTDIVYRPPSDIKYLWSNWFK